MSTDLFPDALLVQCEGDRLYTTTLKVAEHFGKRHKNVLRAVEHLLLDMATEPKNGLSEGFTGLNFEPSEYLDSTGRPLPMYRLSHDGFALLAMGFTGKEALAWKVRFLAAFRDLERQLDAALEREAAWYRDHAATLRAGWYARYPLWLDLRAAATLGQTRAQMARDLGRHPATIGRNLKRMRQVGLLSSNPRRRAAGTPKRQHP